MAGGLGGRAEDGPDLVVGQVVAVAEDDRRSLQGRKKPGQVLDPRVGGKAVELGAIALERRSSLSPADRVYTRPATVRDPGRGTGDFAQA